MCTVYTLNYNIHHLSRHHLAAWFDQAEDAQRYLSLEEAQQMQTSCDPYFDYCFVCGSRWLLSQRIIIFVLDSHQGSMPSLLLRTWCTGCRAGSPSLAQQTEVACCKATISNTCFDFCTCNPESTNYRKHSKSYTNLRLGRS